LWLRSARRSQAQQPILACRGLAELPAQDTSEASPLTAEVEGWLMLRGAVTLWAWLR
jgi:hypothetical protein